MTRVEHYMVLVEGLLALRALKTLSMEVECEVTGVHVMLWEQMTEEEQAQLDGADGLIEQAKRRWGVR